MSVTWNADGLLSKPSQAIRLTPCGRWGHCIVVFTLCQQCGSWAVHHFVSLQVTLCPSLPAICIESLSATIQAGVDEVSGYGEIEVAPGRPEDKDGHIKGTEGKLQCTHATGSITKKPSPHNAHTNQQARLSWPPGLMIACQTKVMVGHQEYQDRRSDTVGWRWTCTRGTRLSLIMLRMMHHGVIWQPYTKHVD